MGLDLKLKVRRYDWPPDMTIDLPLDRSYELFSYFRNIGRGFDIAAVCHPKPLEASRTIYHYSDDGIGETRTDPYGNELTWVIAAEIKRIKYPPEHLTEWNRAALAYVRELPDDTRVYLWWH